ncbi:MAG: hypothetical protein DRI46_09625, partial [Chloroflexi bacterium]
MNTLELQITIPQYKHPLKQSPHFPVTYQVISTTLRRASDGWLVGKIRIKDEEGNTFYIVGGHDYEQRWQYISQVNRTMHVWLRYKLFRQGYIEKSKQSRMAVIINGNEINYHLWPKAKGMT